MEGVVRRHHLIEEAKAELDVAYEEVKRSEQEIMAYEASYNEKSKELNGDGTAGDLSALMAEKETLQDKLGIDQLYILQRVAVERFAQISSVFTIVNSVDAPPVAVDLIRQILFQTDEARARRVEIDRLIREFVSSLKDYSKISSSAENDRKVRDSWGEIENILQDMGHGVVG